MNRNRINNFNPYYSPQQNNDEGITSNFSLAYNPNQSIDFSGYMNSMNDVMSKMQMQYDQTEASISALGNVLKVDAAPFDRELADKLNKEYETGINSIQEGIDPMNLKSSRKALKELANKYKTDVNSGEAKRLIYNKQSYDKWLKDNEDVAKKDPLTFEKARRFYISKYQESLKENAKDAYFQASNVMATPEFNKIVKEYKDLFGDFTNSQAKEAARKLGYNLEGTYISPEKAQEIMMKAALTDNRLSGYFSQEKMFNGLSSQLNPYYLIDKKTGEIVTEEERINLVNKKARNESDFGHRLNVNTPEGLFISTYADALVKDNIKMNLTDEAKMRLQHGYDLERDSIRHNYRLKEIDYKNSNTKAGNITTNYHTNYNGTFKPILEDYKENPQLIEDINKEGTLINTLSKNIKTSLDTDKEFSSLSDKEKEFLIISNIFSKETDPNRIFSDYLAEDILQGENNLPSSFPKEDIKSIREKYKKDKNFRKIVNKASEYITDKKKMLSRSSDKVVVEGVNLKKLDLTYTNLNNTASSDWKVSSDSNRKVDDFNGVNHPLIKQIGNLDKDSNYQIVGFTQILEGNQMTPAIVFLDRNTKSEIFLTNPHNERLVYSISNYNNSSSYVSKIGADLSKKDVLERLKITSQTLNLNSGSKSKIADVSIDGAKVQLVYNKNNLNNIDFVDIISQEGKKLQSLPLPRFEKYLNDIKNIQIVDTQ